MHSRHDPATKTITITHVLGDENGRTGEYGVTLHYSTLNQIDAMAEAAGLTLASRWHDWTGTPLRPDSTDPAGPIYSVIESYLLVKPEKVHE